MDANENRKTVPNWKIPWQNFSANNVPRKDTPIIFLEPSGTYFIGKIDSEGLIKASDSNYIYSKLESQITHFAYIENIRDGLISFPNKPEIDRLIIIKDLHGTPFLGKMNEDSLIERIGTGYRYSIRDGFLISWIYATCPSDLKVSIDRLN
ncbi:hypothetical protein [Leptospira andrefontaineae]|uniref:hypothetical protein n=1 Tax=Leptospira andrefontaineae TaxID=2484976 RepID=UPI001FC98C2D|nr:hypothetical protein [Leptospira andrefontaineae]